MTQFRSTLLFIAVLASLMYGCQGGSASPVLKASDQNTTSTDVASIATVATATVAVTPMLPTDATSSDSAALAALNDALVNIIQMQVNSAQADALLVSGVIEKGGKAGSLSPAYRLDTAPISDTGQGGYAIDFLGSTGVVEMHYMFDPVPVLAEVSETGSDADTSGFSFYLPAGATHSIRLTHDGDLLDELDPGPSAPYIQITSPDEMAARISNGRLQLQWEADDPDGDALTYLVRYSVDGGKIWQILAINLTSTFVELNLAPLGATQQGVVQVLASDGVNTAADTLGPIVTGNQPPAVTIISPLDQTELAAGQPILLIGSGQDPENGTLPDEALVWTSDLLGQLGFGQTVQIDSGLSVGDHMVTLTGVDRTGNRSSQSVMIIVR